MDSITHATMRALGVEGDSSDTVSAVIKATRRGGNDALIGGFFYSTNNYPIGVLMEKAMALRSAQLYAEKVSAPSREYESLPAITDHEWPYASINNTAKRQQHITRTRKEMQLGAPYRQCSCCMRQHYPSTIGLAHRGYLAASLKAARS